MKKTKTLGDIDLSKVIHLNPGLAELEKPKKKSKYRNIKVVVDGIKFDSKKEANYYGLLKLKLKSGLISDLKLQVKFKLLSFSYIADFVYLDNELMRLEVIDVKSRFTKTMPVYKMKKKAMFNELGIKIKEV